MEAFFAADGPLAQAIGGYERRSGQVEMAIDVAATLKEGGVALIEAGTGIGKSMAYLLPAIESGRRTVISTHTISLQQQLMDKEIPTLTSALGIDCKAVLMKGMSNYLCLRRLADGWAERLSMNVEEQEQIEGVQTWVDEGGQGSLSDLPTFPNRPVRERIRMEADGCTRMLCPHYKQCLFFKARKEAEEADLLIVNHHLLLADLALRMEGESSILPDYDQLIIDEAHHLEEVATTIFAERVSRRDLDRLFSRLQGQRHGRLDQIVDRVWKGRGDEGLKGRIQQRIEVMLPAEKRAIQEELHKLFSLIGEERTRLLERHLEEPHWTQNVQPQAQLVADALSNYAQSLRALCTDLEEWKGDERIESLKIDVESFAGRIERIAERIYRFAFDPIDQDQVRWTEENQLYIAQLDISDLLSRHLFSPTRAVVLSSATLATSQQFRFCRERLGLGEEYDVLERIHHSPFNYEEQAIFLLPTDLPPPDHPDFVSQATERIFDAIEASGGGVFVLFTSYRMLDQCERGLSERLKEGGYSLFCQGREARHTLLDQFRNAPRAVLFGTDSFWEGVDVAGDALRCVVLTKLPFRVPTEPIVEAQVDRILAKGGKPFVDYALPHAIVKFKQGFGRLIRNQSDRGCILCLDSRLVTKPYGRAFLQSLPPSPVEKGDRARLLSLLADFYP